MCNFYILLGLVLIWYVTDQGGGTGIIKNFWYCYLDQVWSILPGLDWSNCPCTPAACCNVLKSVWAVYTKNVLWAKFYWYQGYYDLDCVVNHRAELHRGVPRARPIKIMGEILGEGWIHKWSHFWLAVQPLPLYKSHRENAGGQPPIFVPCLLIIYWIDSLYRVSP